MKFKFNFDLNDDNSKPNIIGIIFSLLMLWWTMVLVGMELEREGLWLWGHIIDFVIWCPNKADIFTIICIIVGTSPFWGVALFVWWCSK